MVTQTFKPDCAVPTPADVYEDAASCEQEEDGGVLRGFFYAMLLNVFLVITIAACWGVWRLLR